ncbi:hypothetical protein ACQKIE_00985 [Luteibacter sp. NPDC031894]|uniref:hypothetical protein n=1 Tax=Luteibacter sp. NPDC031894 TaxID=3390572 RepID=UPI003CFEF36F
MNRFKGWLGRNGVPIDAAGQIGHVSSWPWKLRYPIAIFSAIAGIVLFFWLFDAGKDGRLIAWIAAAGAGILILMTAYELVLLALGAGLIWGAFALFNAFVPESWNQKVNLLPYMAGAYAIYKLIEISAKASALEAQHAWTMERMTQLEELIKRGYDSPWYGSTRESLKRIEKRLGTRD